MARQDIYLGVEGNDGTGDSIREAFRKANANFTELYAVFGQGGTITFKALSDTPDVLTPSPPGAAFILGTNQTGTEIIERQIQAGTGITVDSSQEDRIIINNVGANVSADTAPVLGGHLSGNIVYSIGQIATDETAVSQFNTTHGTQITQDDLVIDKKFGDQHYGVNGLFESRADFVRSEPANATEYTKTITEYRNGNLEVIGHGLNSGANGSPFQYKATDAVPTNLVADTIYYIRFVDENFLSLHTTKEQAQNNDSVTRVKVNINNGDTVTPVGTDTIVDNEYDSTLLGFWKNNEALPRESITRRQGDRMEGALFLHDHPGDLAGTDTGITDDLQAATKFYVDNTSFASDVDLFVSTSGDDAQTNSPVGKEGRSLNYAYKSLGKAAQKAQEIIEASPLEPGAYIQTITYDLGEGKSVTNSVGVTSAYADAQPAIDIINENKFFIKKEVLRFIKDTYPDLEYADTNVINPVAEAMLHENRKFIATETIAWINDQIANAGGSGIWNAFTYDQAKCKRDTLKIVAAMVHDIGRGGNLETRRHAASYWSNATNQVFGQVQQTVAALNQTRDIILNNVLPGVQYTYIQDPIVDQQRIFSETVEDGLTARVTELFAIITDTITNGLDSIPAPVATTKSGNTCERDIEQIINGLLIDIGNGVNVNFHAIQAGVRYYSSPSSAKARITQGTSTVAAINQINTVIGQVILQNDVTERQTLFSQFTDSNIAQPSLTVRNSISAKFDIITTIIQNGPSSKPGLVEGSTYTIQFTNGGEDSVDQGVNTNVDILPGKVVRGKTSGAIGRIVRYTSGVDLGGTNYDKVEVVLQEAKEFELGEELEYGNFTRTKQIVINVETGIYYEDYPIKVPANVSIKGSDFRRCIIRPADRTSQSPWINTYFYRDKMIDNLPVTARIGNDLATSQTISISGENDIGKVITVTPADNISPASWEGAWFYTDNGAVGLITDSDVGGTSFTVQLSVDRLPNLSDIPAGQWHIKATQNYGYHYRKDPSDVTSTPLNNKDIDVFLMNDATRLANMTFQGHGGFAQVLDPDGQILIKSPYMQVCGSFSQSINTQAFRGGMYIDAFSGNLEMQIDSKDDNFTLNVSSAVGKGLRIRKPETPAPFFLNGKRYQIDAVSEYDSEAGTAKLLLNRLSNEGNGYDTPVSTPVEIFTQTAGNRSMLANDYTQVNDLGYGLFVNNGALSEQVSTFTYYCHTAFMCNNGSIIRALNCSNSNGNFGLVSAGSDPNEEVDVVTSLRPMTQPVAGYSAGAYTMPVAATSVYVTDTLYPPYNNSLLDIDDGTTVTTYEITNVSVVDGVTASGTKGGSLPVYRLTIGGDDGLAAVINNGDKLEIRQNKNFLFDSVEPATTIRPSTAIIFDEQPTQVYRTISYNNQDSDNSPLPADQSQIVFDSGFDFLNLLLDNTYAARNDYAGAGTTMGATAGDRVIAVQRILSNIDVDRINNADMIFTHGGKTFRVSNYTERTDAGNGDYEYATIVLNDVAGTDINSPASSAGITSTLVLSGGQRTLPLALSSGENATITIAISTLRANGHDFNDIGSGGFNSSNYPGVIYGPPTQTPSQAAEVQERGKGRVFWVSTDQDGFFRVGKYFEVDQGTGTVTFAASIAISNLDGLGFRRGVRISEFSNDDLLSDSDPQAVPTEFAVDEFINRRLHFQRDGTVVGLNRQLGPGVLARDGTTSMTGDLNAGGNNITNLADPRSGQPQDATTKSYVDGRTPFGSEAIGANIGNRATNDILVWTGTNYDNATPAGDIEISYAGNVATFAIATGAIENSDIAANALIAQSKLLLNAATTRNDAVGITQNDLGVASFNDLHFDDLNGWISIKNQALQYELFLDIPQNYVIGRTAAGAGQPNAITFADVVNTGGTFTTTGQADSIVKTKADGGIDGQSLYIDNYKIIDQTANTLNVTTPGGAIIFDSVGTIPSNTTTTFAGSVDIGSVGVAPSTHQKNSSFGSNTDTTLNQSRLGVDWIYSSFIEAPGEKDASGTGIGIGAGTGFSNAGEVAIVANDNQPAVTFQQTKMIPYTNGTYDIGSSTNAFGTMYGQATSAQYADLAENYLADDDYEVGTVVAFGGEQEVTVTRTKGDHRVAGVVSTNPAHLMNSQLQGDNVKPIALQGRVPCKVIGKVEKGDMLVTSAIAGHAIVNNSPGIGQVIGKAVGTKTDDGKGLVEVVVGRV